tara:strand:- start:37 stop:1275 length:1239 start_codon:yes stop_codon:yes gene_type:complete
MVQQVTGLNSLNPPEGIEQQVATIFGARVMKAILDDKNPETAKAFKNFGEWSSIGCLFFNSLNNPNQNKEFTTNNFARPLFPSVSAIPLENEIVYIMSLPNSNIQSDVNDVTYYYFQSINIWQSTHHNGIPDPLSQNTSPESQRQDYQETEAGNIRRVTDGGTEINLGDTFNEKLEIRNMLPYEGDYIYQGRWGNTIRLGSTVPDAAVPNTWSSTGENGDPIMILKNGQHEEDTDPWIPQIEDINTDLSSIYLTSTQTLPIDVASKKYDSYFSSPTSTKEFDSEQVVINSGRILFNAKSDNILLSSFDTINLNSINSLNIDTPKTIIQSKEIYLGDKYATEPVILGDTFLADLQSLLMKINNLTSALMVPMSIYPPVGPNAPLPLVASSVKSQCGKMIGRINKYKSKVSKSK